MANKDFLAGSPYYVEKVLGVNICERAQSGKLTHLLLNQPPICDCHCRRCFMPSYRRGKNIDGLSTKEYCNVIEQAGKEGMFCLEISGEGEPLLSSSLKDIIQCAFDNGFITTLITNGHNLTENFIQFIFNRNVTLIVSLFSLRKSRYEIDNNLPGSFDQTINNIKYAAGVYKGGKKTAEDKTTYRMAIHTTIQADNQVDIKELKCFCEDLDIFFSIAPLAFVGEATKYPEMLLSEQNEMKTSESGHNSIILSSTSKQDIGREVCGTCLYGLNIGYDGNLLFDAHAGYEIGNVLGNVREQSIEELVVRQRKFTKYLFNNIEGFCPVRDPLWSHFLKNFLRDNVNLDWNKSDVFSENPVCA